MSTTINKREIIENEEYCYLSFYAFRHLHVFTNSVLYPQTWPNAAKILARLSDSACCTQDVTQG